MDPEAPAAVDRLCLNVVEQQAADFAGAPKAPMYGLTGIAAASSVDPLGRRSRPQFVAAVQLPGHT